MTDKEFTKIRADAGLTFKQVAEFLRITLRSAQYYESGQREIPGPVEVLMEMLRDDCVPRRFRVAPNKKGRKP